MSTILGYRIKKDGKYFVDYDNRHNCSNYPCGLKEEWGSKAESLLCPSFASAKLVAKQFDGKVVRCVKKENLIFQNVDVEGELLDEADTYKEVLMTIQDIVWDEAMCDIDVEHTIRYHADDLPIYYRRVSAAVEKIQRVLQETFLKGEG